jgi:hypothetical protein
LLEKKGSLDQILSELFPHFSSEKTDKSSQTYLLNKGQSYLYQLLKKMHAGMEVWLNYKHPDLTFGDSSKHMELDIFIPSQMLAFEYQGTL